MPERTTVALRGLKVRDFQSLAQVELELGQLTVIVGASNSGKSAVVRALQAALFNRSGGEFVREGAESCRVELAFAGGNLVWTKPRKGGATYEICTGEAAKLRTSPVLDRLIQGSAAASITAPDGGVLQLTRVGKQMPPEIEALTGVREIQIETLKARLQFAGQFEEPFLLAGTGGQAAKLLARLSKLDVLVTAQVLARRDMERTRRVGADAESLAIDLRDRLAAQPDYEWLLARWQALQERAEILSLDEKRLVEAKALANRLQEMVRLQAAWAAKQLPARMAAVGEEAARLTEAGQAVAAFQEATVAVERGRSQLAAAEGTLKRVEEELHDVLNGLEVCPVCGRPM